MEQLERGDVLAVVEQAGIFIYEATHLLSAGRQRMESLCGEHDGVFVFCDFARVACGDTYA